MLMFGNKPVNRFVGWSGLVNNLVIENIWGLKREDGNLCLIPRVPKNGFPKAVLYVPQQQLKIEAEITNDSYSITVTRNGRATRHSTSYGKSIII